MRCACCFVVIALEKNLTEHYAFLFADYGMYDETRFNYKEEKSLDDEKHEKDFSNAVDDYFLEDIRKTLRKSQPNCNEYGSFLPGIAQHLKYIEGSGVSAVKDLVDEDSQGGIRTFLLFGLLCGSRIGDEKHLQRLREYLQNAVDTGGWELGLHGLGAALACANPDDIVSNFPESVCVVE